MKKKLLVGLSTCLVVFSMTSLAMAVPLVLDHESVWATTGGMGTGRGILFHADESFSINSVGIFADLFLTSYDVDIYESTGMNNYGSLLTTASAQVGGTTLEYQTININFTFNADNYYFLNWTRSDNATMYNSMTYLIDQDLPTDYGVLTLLDGTEGSTSINFNNYLHGQFALDVDNAAPVPEPATMLLFGTGLAGLAGLRRRQGKK